MVIRWFVKQYKKLFHGGIKVQRQCPSCYVKWYGIYWDLRHLDGGAWKLCDDCAHKE